MKKNEVRQYIGSELEKAKRRSDMDTDSMLELLCAVASTSPASLGYLEEENGKQKVVWKSFEELDEETKKAIAIIKNTREGVEIGLLDRMKAIEMLFKYMGLEAKGEGTVLIVGEKDIED